MPKDLALSHVHGRLVSRPPCKGCSPMIEYARVPQQHSAVVSSTRHFWGHLVQSLNDGWGNRGRNILLVPVYIFWTTNTVLVYPRLPLVSPLPHLLLGIICWPPFCLPCKLSFQLAFLVVIFPFRGPLLFANVFQTNQSSLALSSEFPPYFQLPVATLSWLSKAFLLAGYRRWIPLLNS